MTGSLREQTDQSIDNCILIHVCVKNDTLNQTPGMFDEISTLVLKPITLFISVGPSLGELGMCMLGYMWLWVVFDDLCTLVNRFLR